MRALLLTGFGESHLTLLDGSQDSIVFMRLESRDGYVLDLPISKDQLDILAQAIHTPEDVEAGAEEASAEERSGGIEMPNISTTAAPPTDDEDYDGDYATSDESMDFDDDDEAPLRIRTALPQGTQYEEDEL